MLALLGPCTILVRRIQRFSFSGCDVSCRDTANLQYVGEPPGITVSVALKANLDHQGPKLVQLIVVAIVNRQENHEDYYTTMVLGYIELCSNRRCRIIHSAAAPQPLRSRSTAVRSGVPIQMVCPLSVGPICPTCWNYGLYTIMSSRLVWIPQWDTGNVVAAALIHIVFTTSRSS